MIRIMRHMDQLQSFRAEIDKIDRKLVGVLVERMSVVEEIKKYKKNTGEDARDDRRAKEILETRVTMGGKLSSYFMRDIFALIIKHSEELQRK